MAQVVITKRLEGEINKKFKHESIKVFSLMRSLEENPKKGKEIGNISKIIIKDIRYNKFRFYFLTDGYKIKFFKIEDLRDLIIKFVRMSEKKDQERVIEDIKDVLRKLGEEGF